MRAASLGAGHPRGGGVALGLQLQKRAAVVLRRHLDEGGERIAPVLEKHPGAGAAGKEEMALDNDAQPLGVETQRVAHAPVDDAERALARAVVVISLVALLFGCLADRVEIDPGM